MAATSGWRRRHGATGPGIQPGGIRTVTAKASQEGLNQRFASKPALTRAGAGPVGLGESAEDPSGALARQLGRSIDARGRVQQTTGLR